MNTRNGTGSRVGAQLDERVDSIKESVKNLVDKGEERAHMLKERVIEVKDQAKDRGGALLDRSTDFIKANPIKSVALAFGIGYLGMRIFR